ncbi:MAG TPA: hypothetical protein VHR16_02805 [Candidatus Limnocylindrales bacterium]|jgi:hypothetical protein|nr:hypothetical protein [Candidatus Limnocylindrales bacterium]
MVDGPVDQPQPSFFSAFDHLLATCRRTRGALQAVVHHDHSDGDAVRDVLARDALAHIEAVLEGMLALRRTGQFSSEELRELVQRAGIVAPPLPGTAAGRAAEQEAANEAAHDGPRLRAIDGRTMLAAGHARVVFSVIPRLPADAVTWPRNPRSYADIPVPRSEGELLVRAEELARVVWRVAAGDERRDEPLRRTLAFFEAGSRLSFRGFQAA